MKNYILEVCVDSVESAINASNAGGSRLELCSNLLIGGTSPSKMLFKEIVKQVNTPIYVLIRPRYGDFCYSEFEFNIMRNEIKMFEKLGAQGVVIGILNPNGSLDCDRMKILIEDAGDMSVTLHRAFDMCREPFKVLEHAKELGIKTILTSGQANDCIDGIHTLKELVARSKGEIDILIGGGISAGIISDIYKFTKATSFHMSGKVVIPGKMEFRNDRVNMGIKGVNEYAIWQTKEDNIRKAIAVLEEL